jgi:protein phosphatase
VTRLVGSAHSDVGRVRTVNQDAALASERLHLFAVADGMGGHRGGEVASELALQALSSATGDQELGSADALVDAVLDANDRVFDQSRNDPDLFGMGTTLCALALVGGGTPEERLVIANVGDSRAYLLQQGELAQLTVDHSLVQDMVRGGHLTPDEAVNHPKRNIVTRALGIEPDVLVDFWERDAVPGDRYLLCSDGLFNEVPEPRIAATLRRLADPDAAARDLVQQANAGGGRDNVTCVVVDVVEDGQADGAADPGPTAARTLAATLAAEEAPPSEPRPKRLTFRLATFIVAIGVVAAVAYFAIRTFARNNYFVGSAGDEVVIFRGRPGGMLWFDPETATTTGIKLSELTPEQREKVADLFETSSLGEAVTWVGQQLRTTTTTTTTATTTSTTGPATTVATTAPPLGETGPGGPPEPGTTVAGVAGAG